MRKMISWLVTIVMLVSMFAPITVSATLEQSKPELMIYSQECPQAVVSYATQSYLHHVNSMASLDLLKISGRVSLGSPFTIMDDESNQPVFYFPVINNNKIIATFRVYVDESRTKNVSTPIYAGILSEFMVPELNRLSSLTSKDAIALLYMDNHNVMLRINGQTELLIESPEGDAPTSTIATVRSNYQVAQAFDAIAEGAVSNDQDRSSTRILLAVNINETQPSGREWCAAYAASLIIRYKINSTSPRSYHIMSMFHGTNPAETDRLTDSQVIQAANSYDLYPVLASYRISNGSVISQIQSYSPVYFVGQRTTNGEHGYHAMVICGYDLTTNMLMIWNPWYDHLETINMNFSQYVAGDYSYTWVRTIYNWQ